MSAPEAPPKRRGCFFYGCLITLVLGLLIVVGGGLGIRYAISNFILTYTDTSPMTLPKVEMSQVELDQLKSRVSDFNRALENHTKTPPLVLTAREINALLANLHQAKDKHLDGRFYISLEGSEAKGQVSLPLDNMHIPTVSTKGRYLNGVASFSAAITNGIQQLTFHKLEVKGKTAPESFQSFMQSYSDALIMELNKDPKSSAAMKQIESLQIKDSTVIIQAKQ